MIGETVKAVRAAEDAAKERIAKAREEAEELLNTARAEAEKAVADAETRAAADRKAAEQKAEEDGAKMIEFSAIEAERDISALKHIAETNEGAAIDTILRELI